MKNAMERRGPEIVIGLAGALALCLVGCLMYIRGCGGGGAPVYARSAQSVQSETGEPELRAIYRHDGPAVLNDLDFTPGGVAAATAAQLCAKDFHTGDVRAVPRSRKFAVCKLYGIDRAHCIGLQPDGSGYEIDHLVSLELGGSNEPENLWPQPYSPKPGAKEKDLVENWLHAQVCSGKVDLGTAQEQIRTDWYRVFLTLHTEAKTEAGDAPGEKTQIWPVAGSGKIFGATPAPGR